MTLPGTSSSRAIVTAQYVVVYGALMLMAVALVSVGYFLWLLPPPVAHVATARAVLTFENGEAAESAPRTLVTADTDLIRVRPGLSVTYFRRIRVVRPAIGYRKVSWLCNGNYYELETKQEVFDRAGEQDLITTVKLPLAVPEVRCEFQVSLTFPRDPFGPQTVWLPPVPVEVVGNDEATGEAPPDDAPDDAPDEEVPDDAPSP